MSSRVNEYVIYSTKHVINIIICNVMFYRLLDKTKTVQCRAVIGTLVAAKSSSVDKWRKLVSHYTQVLAKY